MAINRRDMMLATTAALLVLPAVRAHAQTPQNAAKQNFDDGWTFAFGHANDIRKDFGFGKKRMFAKQGPDAAVVTKYDFDDSGWRSLTLPHDWAVELPFVKNDAFTKKIGGTFEENWDQASDWGYKPLGRDFPETSIGWYRKTFALKAISDERYLLEFEGLFRDAVVMVNGYVVAEHESGYVPLYVDITDFLNTDDTLNTLAVRLDATKGEGWFYEGAGIYRHVWLHKKDAVHIPIDGVFVTAKTDGEVNVTTTLVNKSPESKPFVLKQWAAYEGSEERHLVAQSVGTIPALATISVSTQLRVENPKLWSVDDPNLYRLSSELSSDAAFSKEVVTFGFRDILFDAEKGFFLNGKPLKIKGTCNHQDHAGVGSAIPDALNIWRIIMLKEMGCNAYRASHNPPTKAVLDACDRHGMLVIDETRMMTSSEEGLKQLETLIKRDRNHPSVIAWSIGNEEPQQGTKRGLKIALAMRAVCKKLDPTRPVTAAMDNGFGEGITEALDVIGFNYRDGKIDAFHEKYPNLPIIGSETGSTVSTRGEYRRDEANNLVPAYDTDAPWWASTAEGYWPHFAEKPYIAGGFIWTGFDYRGEPTPFNHWPSISSQFGVLDICGNPKDNYYYYQAWWQDQPVLHLFPHWNWPKEGEIVPVWVHSNLDAVELKLNGKSLGKKTVIPNRHLEWQVPFKAGKIEALGYKGGKIVERTVRETAGEPAAIKLSVERTQSLDATQSDIVTVTATLVDKRGIVVPKADNLVTFTVQKGDIIGVGNGNPNSHEPDKATSRKAFNGLCNAIIAVKRGELVNITAQCTGLKTNSLTV